MLRGVWSATRRRRLCESPGSVLRIVWSWTPPPLVGAGLGLDEYRLCNGNNVILQHYQSHSSVDTREQDILRRIASLGDGGSGQGDSSSTNMDSSSTIDSKMMDTINTKRQRDTPTSTASLRRTTGLSGFQKGLLGVLASWGAFRDPRRADLVAIVGETTGSMALSMILDRMKRSESGRKVLDMKPRVTDRDTLEKLQDMPASTFGGAYYSFMKNRGFHADERPAVRCIDDPELAYVATRVREVHDFWHVLFGCHTDVLGEAALKAVEFVQTGMPMTGMAVLAAEWRLSTPKRQMLNTVYVPWAIHAGSRAADLMCLYYEEHFDRDIDELREAWRIIPCPDV